MRVSYSPGYFVPLPEDHPFPMGKFPVLRQILLAEGVLRPKEIVEPWEADWADLLLVHTSEYLSALAGGTLGAAGQRRLGLPWSEALVRRSRLAVQGTVNAAEMALEGGIAGNLAGGTHHAFADHGEGYCVLNDVAVAIRVLRARHLIRRALVVDLDVHQGNGTACIFAGDPLTYTFSMHGENNYPFTKVTSSLDVGLPDNTLDTAYLDVLAAHFTKAFEDARPDLVFYLAGVDPVAGDRFGRLALTRQGLRERDRYVLDSVQRHGAPVTLLLSGGYAKTAELTADLHATVYREAVRITH